MAVISTINPTLLDVVTAQAPDGTIAPVAEVLNQSAEILQDMTFVEGNLQTGNVSVMRSGIPDVAFRKLYGGVQPGKSRRVKVTDSCGMLEAYAEIDKALADLNGNAAAFRLSEDKAYIEGMAQKAASSVFYANEALVPEGFTGIVPRFNDLTAENAVNLIDGGAATGQTDVTSIYLIGWSPETVFGIYPKGSTAGLHMTDKGVVTLENVDGLGGRMEAYRTHYRWDLGLTVKDWRYISRIHSIDLSTLKADASSGPDLIELMIQAEEQIPNLGNVRLAWYMPKTLRTFLRLQKLKKTAYQVTDEQVAGKRVMMFNGIPIRRTDAILLTEQNLH